MTRVSAIDDTQASSGATREVEGSGRRRRAIAVLAVVLLVLLVLLWRRQGPGLASVELVAAGGIACSERDPAAVDPVAVTPTSDPHVAPTVPPTTDPHVAPTVPASAAADPAAAVPAPPAVGPDVPRCLSQVTSDLAVGLGPDVVAGLGDYQYEDAKADSYRSQYDPGWGRLRDITRPALGNQEYKVHAANTFFAYFGDQAGPRSGWYSYDIGSWHVVVLNSNCDLAGGCGPDSPQVQWLREDLAAHDGTRCTLAYWHHPRFSTGLHGSDARSATFWEVLAAHHADVVLAAHEHDYQRFEPVNPAGGSDPLGILSFVVGTGGQATYAPDETTGEAGRRRAAATAPAVRVDDTVGVLGLTLDPESYRWRFVDATGATRDQGTAACQ